MELGKIARQTRVHGGVGVVVREDVQGEGRGGGLGMAWGNGTYGGRKDGYGSREVYIVTKRAILGFARDLILEGFPVKIK